MAQSIPGQYGLDDPTGARNNDRSIRTISAAAGNVPMYMAPFPVPGSYPGTSGLNHPDGGVNSDLSAKKIK